MLKAKAKEENDSEKKVAEVDTNIDSLTFNVYKRRTCLDQLIVPAYLLWGYH